MTEERETLHKCPKCGEKIVKKVRVLSEEASQKRRDAGRDFSKAFPEVKVVGQDAKGPIELFLEFYCPDCERTFKNEEALAPGPEDLRYYCHLCQKVTVKETFENVFNAAYGSPVLGGPVCMSQYSTKSRGYHCTVCGIKYEFPTAAKDDQ